MSYNPVDIDKMLENVVCPMCHRKNVAHLIQDWYTFLPLSVTLEVKCLFCNKMYEEFFIEPEIIFKQKLEGKCF